MNHPHESSDLNRDPISGAPGSHPVGVGVGGIAGAAAGGALAGTVFGPIGTLIGAGVGTLVGAAAGKGVAEKIDPTADTEYWRSEHASRPYVQPDYDFDRDYAAAYAFGREAREADHDRTWASAEHDLRDRWEARRGDSRLSWEQARPAVRDSWNRTDRTHATYRAADEHFLPRFTDAGDRGGSWDDHRPAYRYGVLARTAHGSREWDDNLDRQLASNWERHRGNSHLDWEGARPSVREAYTSPYYRDYNTDYDAKPDYHDDEGPSTGLFRTH